MSKDKFKKALRNAEAERLDALAQAAALRVAAVQAANDRLLVESKATRYRRGLEDVLALSGAVGEDVPSPEQTVDAMRAAADAALGTDQGAEAGA